MNIFEWDEQTPVTANNMNEMQNILNDNIRNAIASQINLTTGGEAVPTGRIIDGKTEYVKRILLNGFPGNNQTKTWVTGINMSNIIVTDLTITVKSGSGNWFPMPNNDVVSSRTSLDSNGNINVTMFVGNLQGLNGYAEIQYYYNN